MMFLLSVILVSITGVFTDSCNGRDVGCETYIPEDYPRNREELENSCRAFQDAAVCILSVKENCKEFESEEERQENEMLIPAIKKFIQFLNVSCDTDSSIFQVISNHIECAYSVFKNLNTTCEFKKFKETREEAAKMFEDMFKKTEDEDLQFCLKDIWHITCIATSVSDNCGQEVLLPMAEVLTKLNIGILMYCDQDLFDEIPAYVQAIAFGEHQAEKDKQEVRKKK